MRAARGDLLLAGSSGIGRRRGARHAKLSEQPEPLPRRPHSTWTTLLTAHSETEYAARRSTSAASDFHPALVFSGATEEASSGPGTQVRPTRLDQAISHLPEQSASAIAQETTRVADHETGSSPSFVAARAEAAHRGLNRYGERDERRGSENVGGGV
jgi:hypothetical protein